MHVSPYWIKALASEEKPLSPHATTREREREKERERLKALSSRFSPTSASRANCNLRFSGACIGFFFFFYVEHGWEVLAGFVLLDTERERGGGGGISCFCRVDTCERCVRVECADKLCGIKGEL